jgi:ferredoxin-NADP reductase
MKVLCRVARRPVTVRHESRPVDGPGSPDTSTRRCWTVACRAELRHQDYFVYGPPAMVVTVSQLLRARGIAAHRIHTEQFDVA